MDHTGACARGSASADPFYKALPTTTCAFSTGLSSAGTQFTPAASTTGYVGCCDIVDSTSLIAAGTVQNRQYGRGILYRGTDECRFADMQPFPFVFGGDGTSFAVPPHLAECAEQELAKLRAWVAQEFDVELRAALLPVGKIRKEGRDVRVARFAASAHLDYAMFEGGGLVLAGRADEIRPLWASPPADHTCTAA